MGILGGILVLLAALCCWLADPIIGPLRHRTAVALALGTAFYYLAGAAALCAMAQLGWRVLTLAGLVAEPCA